MKKLVLVLVTVVAVVAAALIPPGRPVVAAGPGFASAVSAVRQPSWQTNASVNAVGIAGGLTFIGGLFTHVRPPDKPAGQGDVRRTYLAAFYQSSGQATAWAPTLNGPVWSIAVSQDGQWVVVGGDFTSVNGQPRNRIAMFNNKGQLTSFKPGVAHRVKALAVYGNNVYLGGSFGRVSGVVRNRLAAVTLNGTLLPWNPNADDDVYAIDVADNGSRVFAGGPFATIGGKDHYSLAAIHPTTGAPQSFPAADAIPDPSVGCVTRVKDIDTLGSKVFVANGGDGPGCYDGILAADVASGNLLWQSHCLGATEAVKAIGNWLYKGSHAHDCTDDDPKYFGDGTGTHYLLVHDATTKKLGPWHPATNAGGTTKVGPLAMAGTSTELWVGGDFTKVNGANQQGIVRFTNKVPGARPSTPATPVATSPAANQARITFKTVGDLDNITLTYKLFRGTTQIGAWNATQFPWEAAKPFGIVDNGVRTGQTVSYHIQILDGYHVVKSANSAPITIR